MQLYKITPKLNCNAYGSTTENGGESNARETDISGGKTNNPRSGA